MIHADVIGDPIAHSRSPLIHGWWLAQLGIEARYDRQRVERGGVAAYLARRRGVPEWRGCNVTMPLKLEALQAAGSASDSALAAGAANLLVPRGDGLYADNSDVGAIALLVGRAATAGAAMASITLFGTGGAARGALVALTRLGHRNIRIQARDMAAALKLAVEFGLDQAPGTILDPVVSDGLVNATPLGMAGTGCLNCDLTRMPAGGWVFDMVTDPADTDLLVAARGRGLRTIGGLEMLVEQAATSFQALFGVAPPRDRDDGLWQALARYPTS